MTPKSVSEAWKSEKVLWVAYIAMWIAGLATDVIAAKDIAGSLVAFLAFGSTAMLFYIAYRLGKQKSETKAVVMLGVGINLVFHGFRFFVPLMFVLLTGALDLQGGAAGIYAGIYGALLFTSFVLPILFSAALVYVGYGFGRASLDGKQKPVRPKTIKFAGFWIRFAAFIIDWIIIFGAFIALAAVFGVIGSAAGTQGSEAKQAFQSINSIIWPFIAVSWMLFTQAYFIYFNHTTGQTIGKRALGLQVIKGYNGLNWTDSVVRHLVYMLNLAILTIGFWWMAFDKEKQGFHDKAAGTHVIILNQEPEKAEEDKPSNTKIRRKK